MAAAHALFELSRPSLPRARRHAWLRRDRGRDRAARRMTDVPPVLRSLLADAFPDSPRLVRIFEDLVLALTEAKDTADAAASGEVAGGAVLLQVASPALPNG